METVYKPKTTLWSFFTATNGQHKYILSLCLQYGWSKPHPKTGHFVADLGALDAWLKGKYINGQSPVKKPLNEMTKAELSSVIYALEQMIFKKYSRV